jgi:hypothetical protein
MAKIDSHDEVNPELLARGLATLLHRLESAAKDDSTYSPSSNVNASFNLRKLQANLDFARGLLLRLEHNSANLKIASQKQALQNHLLAQRDHVKRLQMRIRELDRKAAAEEVELDKEDDSGDDDDDEDSELERAPSYAPALKGVSGGINTEPTAVEEAASNLASKVRSRKGNAANEAAATSTGASYGFDEKDELVRRERALEADRKTQEGIKDDLYELAKQLRLSATGIGSQISSEKGILERATSALDISTSGLESAGKRLGSIRRLSEGRGWFGRMLLHAYIAGLWLLAFLIVFLLPKLRF